MFINLKNFKGKKIMKLSNKFFGAFLAGLIIAFMAAAVPAYQSLRLKVVDALREA